MIKKFNIAITTFSKRYGYIENLIPQIRQHTDNNILLIVNGEKNGEFDDEYRKKILTLSASYVNVFPIFYIETRGLCKLWNTAIVSSNDDDILVLNDDIEIISKDIFDITSEVINADYYNGLTVINESFSHFIVNKITIDKIGYFDERLLGFGEEDGDITFRALKNGIRINNVRVNGVINIVSNIRHEHIIAGIGKYSSFNRKFIYNDKYEPNLNGQYKGMFDTFMDQKLEDIKLYPYEEFFRANKNNL